MSQLTLQDIASVVETLLDRKLDERFGNFSKEVDEKLEQQASESSEKLEHQTKALDEKLEQQTKALSDKLEHQTGLLVEHFDNKCDGLAEAIQVVNANTSSLVRQRDLQAVQYDIKTIKVAVRATNDDLWR
jgi:hypothetical protein